MTWEWGYGAPAALGVPGVGEEYPWGYGDPAGGTFGQGIESGGYGSIFGIGPANIVVQVQGNVAPDDGGVVVTLIGPWPDRGPYRVRLVNANGYTFPTDGSWCWCGVPSPYVPAVPPPGGAPATIPPADRAPWDLYTDVTQETLSFILPPLPPQSNYAIRVYSGPTFQTTFDVTPGVKVVYRARTPMTYRLRSEFPPWVATSARTIQQETYEVQPGVPNQENAEWPHGPFSEVCHSAGEVLNKTVGTVATRLREPLEPGDADAQVESTLGFGSSGAVWIAGVYFTYESKTDYALINVSTGVDRTQTFPVPSDVVQDMISVPNDTDVNARLLAMRNTTVEGAIGDDLVSLSTYLGLPYIHGWDQGSWRLALKALAMGPRSLPGGTWGFLRGIFSFAETPIPCTVNAGLPQRITRISGTFDADDVGRLFDVNGVLYFSVELGGGGGWLNLAPIGTAYWSRAAWSFTGAIVATRLAFTIEEPTPGPAGGQGVPCTVIVRVWVDTPILVPPTYLQPDGLTTRPVGEPYGGQVLQYPVQDGNQTTGPFPPYLLGGELYAELAGVFSAALPPGHYVQFRLGHL